MTAWFTAVRLIWNHVTFLEKMSQDYLGRDGRGSLNWSVHLPANQWHFLAGHTPALLLQCFLSAWWCAASLDDVHSQHLPRSEHSEPLLCSALQLLLKKVLSSSNPCSSTWEGILPGTALLLFGNVTPVPLSLLPTHKHPSQACRTSLLMVENNDL